MCVTLKHCLEPYISGVNGKLTYRISFVQVEMIHKEYLSTGY